MSTVDLQPAEWPVAVIGAGRMGVAIGHIFASAGHPLTLIEPVDAARDTALDRLAALQAQDGRSALGRRVRVAAGLDAAAGARLVIECAPEHLETKQAIFAALEPVCRPDAILATNTSVIPVGAITERVAAKARTLGAHFWNPPHIVRLVEVVQAEATAVETVDTVIALMRQAGQLPVHVRKDVVGFIGNRMQHALKREAIALVQNGVADAETVDFVIRNSFGARLGIVGTLENSDLVGLNLTLAIHEVILKDLDRSQEPQQLLVDLVRAGKTGAAAGEGFRPYTPAQRDELRTRLERLLPKAGPAQSVAAG